MSRADILVDNLVDSGILDLLRERNLEKKCTTDYFLLNVFNCAQQASE